ncbi:MAG TPA: hypothetical protein H9663_02030 [Firmicutes bacterium]|nr:hypothetical protein [Bacillota bacterium]
MIITFFGCHNYPRCKYTKPYVPQRTH